MSCEWHLHSYTGCDYEFIILFLGENIYITTSNVSVSGRRSCPENVTDKLMNFVLIFCFYSSNLFGKMFIILTRLILLNNWLIKFLNIKLANKIY